MDTAPTPSALPGAADGACRLPDWGLLRAEGPDARSFLNGQLTQEVLKLGPGDHRLAGYCSAKGRLLGSFVVWAADDGDALWLACSADLAEALRKRLAMFVLRARCTLTDATAQRPLWGLAGPSAAAWLGAGAPVAPATVASVHGGQAVRLPDAEGTARWLWAAPADAAAPALGELPPGAWAWLEVAAGVPRITAVNVEQFVPQMVNLELVGGVNFQKGCYPGQEVVARSQYRGTLKRRLSRWASPVAATAGADLYDPADPTQPAGRVVLAASVAKADGASAHSLLAEAKITAATGGTLHLGAADGPALSPLPLPYPVPADQADAA